MASAPMLPGRLVRFALVGVVACLVDMAVLQVFFAGGFGLYASRVVSYLCAATVAWWLNRRFTFANRRRASMVQEWRLYLAANLWGGLLNYGVYALLVANSPVFGTYPFLAVAVGSLAGLALNFAMSSRFVFTRAGERLGGRLIGVIIAPRFPLLRWRSSRTHSRRFDRNR